MTYNGHVENGAIILDDAIRLEEGTAVSVEVSRGQSILGPGDSRMQHYGELIGALDDMPADWAENHDFYLREPQGQ